MRRARTAPEWPPRMQFDVANRLFFRLYQCSNLMHKAGTRHVEEFGATTQQWAVIGALARPIVLSRGGISVKELIEFLLLSRQNLALVLERLEARGWIERVRSAADGRTRLVRLSDEGQRVWQQMHVKIEAFYAGALGELSDEEQLLLYRLLDRLKSGLETV